MARTAQTLPPAGESKWRQHQYTDHLGKTVVLGKVSYGRDFYEPEDREGYRVQIYSTSPMQPEDFYKLDGYFFEDVERVFLEIYSYNPPDAFACIEHQRHEIAHRKRLHADARQSPDALPPLIPTINYEPRSHTFRSGFCILLTSESYQAGHVFSRRENLGFGPLFINFDRRFPSEIREVDLLRRIEGPLQDYYSVAEYDLGVYSEARDIKVLAKNAQENMDRDLYGILGGIYVYNPSAEFDYGLDEPLPPQTTLDSQQVREILEQQQTAEVRSVDPITLHLTWESGDRALIATNNSASANSDLQYEIFVPFLISIQDPALLETTARTFTAAILSRIAANKTVYFKFQVPESSMSSLLSLSNEFPVGALQSLKPGSQPERVLPLDRIDPHFPHKLFALVLDKPAFVQEPGVLFFILWTDRPHDKPPGYIENPQTEDDHKNNCFMNIDRDFVEVNRSAEISEAARRLAMPAMERGVDFGHRVLSPEEHRSLLSMSPEEYQSFVDKAKENMSSEDDHNGDDGDDGDD